MTRRFKVMVEGRGGWCEWIHPEPNSYFMKCCDCGLVHELQFKTFVETEQNKRRKTFSIVDLPWPIRAKFRARRARKK